MMKGYKDDPDLADTVEDVEKEAYLEPRTAMKKKKRRRVTAEQAAAALAAKEV